MKNADKPAYAFTDGDTFKHDGLTKRERFAMAAMQGLCANPEHIDGDAKDISQWSIAMADTLLNELEETE